jgi:DNA-binding Lrp family transcriptional regulator
MRGQDLDLVDRKILTELDRNSRMSYSEIGKRTRVAKETVKYRITQLEKAGIIQGYYTVLDFSRVGFAIYRLYLRLKDASPEEEKQFTDYLAAHKQTAVLYRANGPYHLVLGVWAKNSWDAEQYWLALNARFGRLMAKYHVSQMTEYVEYTRPYLLPPSKSSEFPYKETFGTVSEKAAERLDDLDFLLIRYLSTRARASLVELSAGLKVSIVTVRQRLKTLQKKGVIVGFRTIFDLSALGREYYKVDLWLSDHTKRKEIESFVRSLPNCAYAERTVVTSDVEFDLEVEGLEDFIKTMDSIKERFPEAIRDYEFYPRVIVHKIAYAPE